MVARPNKKLANRTQKRVFCVGVVRQTLSSWFIAWKGVVFYLLFFHNNFCEIFLIFSLNSTDLDDLGVQSGDYVIIHNETISMSGIDDLEAECKVVYNAAGVSLTFGLTQCNPTVVISLVMLLQSCKLGRAFLVGLALKVGKIPGIYICII